MAICLLASPFKTSYGVNTRNTKKITMTTKNSIDGLAQLLYKAIMSKAIVINTM
jgi:hypothetical protein